ncbi:MAG: TolC family protein [Planctomycetia bacterium]|nr:TolC family protein [Planctomycetia bacterium]
MKTRVISAVLAAIAALAGCSARYYEQQADKEAYAIIRAKQKKVFGAERPFWIAFPLPMNTVLAPARPEPEGLRHLNLAQCLQIANRRNRDYQSRKETVYIAALALTAARYDFDPHWTAGLGTTWNRSSSNVQNLDSSADIGVSHRLKQGAALTASVGLTALKFVNSGLAEEIQASLDFAVSQPLWRGVDPRIVQENLIQSERNALYAVRSFARFEKTFAVRVADRYFRVLEQQDEVGNTKQNYESLKASRERAEWLAKAGRIKQFQVDQTRQDELQAENRWINARERYTTLLDEFKIVLGLATDAAIELDRADLDRLAAGGLEAVDVAVADAVKEALEKRLDLKNSHDAVDDARRKVNVARDDLKGDIALVASWGMDTPTVARGTRLRLTEGAGAVSIDFDLPLDRLTERNGLRSSQISLNRATRSWTLKEDNVKLEVRTAYERLQRALKSYRIQQLSVELAQKRVESTELLLEAGRVITRDVLEAKRALLDAKNSLTQSLVDYTVSNLEFRRDMGTLTVDEKGLIHDDILKLDD